ncbi:MAG: homoserine O-acetyltransferase, partial [Candidatus Margulisiibacteriota bacterium]
DVLKTQHGVFRIAEPPHELLLECGEKLGPIDIDWESYGELNAEKNNAILVCHALTGDSHVAGKADPKDPKTGWWDPMVGPGKPLDTNKYFIICSNILGGCSGTTGPSSINPRTGQPYAMTLPTVTIKDMVNCQKELVEKKFGIKKLLSVIGGSIGGMQVLKWAVLYPELVESIIPLSTTAKLTPQAIAFNKIGRRAIMLDPKWNNGSYYKDQPELDGLALARMVAHITYLSEEGMRQKFGRDSRDHSIFELNDSFEVEHYLDHQGYSFIKRFDANSYIYLSKAMDIFDLSRNYDSIEAALKRINAKVLTITFTSDWLFPPFQTEELVEILQKNDVDIEYHKLESPKGHDAFLIEYKLINPIITSFLQRVERKS